MFIMDEIRENTAGAIMTPEFVRLRAGTRVSEAIRAVRASGLDSDALYTLFITDKEGRLLGTLELRTLLAAPGDAPLGTLMDTAFTAASITPVWPTMSPFGKLTRQYRYAPLFSSEIRRSVICAHCIHGLCSKGITSEGISI